MPTPIAFAAVALSNHLMPNTVFEAKNEAQLTALAALAQAPSQGLPKSLKPKTVQLTVMEAR